MKNQFEFEDEKIRCAECGMMFDFSAGEQRYYQTRSYQKPKRCKPCRDQRKARVGARE